MQPMGVHKGEWCMEFAPRRTRDPVFNGHIKHGQFASVSVIAQIHQRTSYQVGSEIEHTTAWYLTDAPDLILNHLGDIHPWNESYCTFAPKIELWAGWVGMSNSLVGWI
jgi:hypothetical protein